MSVHIEFLLSCDNAKNVKSVLHISPFAPRKD